MHQILETVPPHILIQIKDLDLNISSKNCMDAINNVLQDTVLVGGKRLRPLITYLMGNLFEVSMERMDDPARGIEMVHAASLAHDDVIDNATTRRGQPSINIVSSNKRAVLAGDYLLSDVIALIARTGNLKLVEEIAKVIQELSEGEWIQLDASEGRDYSREIIKEIAMKKTASVMSFCCYSSAYLAGHNQDVIELCRKLGQNIGVAFQFIDDTLDFSGDSLKDQQLDLQNGIVNAVVFEWLELNSDFKNQFIEGKSLIELSKNMQEGESLKKAIDIVTKNALSLLDEGKEIINQIAFKLDLNEESLIKFNEARKPLDTIIDYLASRTH
jgi:octaprenyl-diphosphate synthase